MRGQPQSHELEWFEARSRQRTQNRQVPDQSIPSGEVSGKAPVTVRSRRSSRSDPGCHRRRNGVARVPRRCGDRWRNALGGDRGCSRTRATPASGQGVSADIIEASAGLCPRSATCWRRHHPEPKPLRKPSGPRPLVHCPFRRETGGDAAGVTALPDGATVALCPQLLSLTGAASNQGTTLGEPPVPAVSGDRWLRRGR